MALVEEPTVKPWLPVLTLENLNTYLADPRTVALIDGQACAVFEWSAPGCYEGHYVFGADCRGKQAIIAATDICGIMINDYGARMLWGEIKLSNRHARWFSRQIGFRSLGVEARPDEAREVFLMERSDVS